MDGLTPPFQALPPEAPLAMPVQSLRTAPPRSGRPASSPPRMGLRRLLVLGGAVVLTGFAAREMHRQDSQDGRRGGGGFFGFGF